MNKVTLFLVVLLAAILRLVTVPNLLSFTPDEAYQAYLAQTIIKDFHIIWIGMSAGSFDLFLGPFWIYIIYPFLLITKGNPLVLGYIASLLGIFTTLLLYFLGKKLFNERVGLIASLLYASSSLIVYYDQKPYPTGISLLSVLIALSLYMSKYSNKWWLLFAFSYGLVFHIHLSLILLIFVAFYWAFLQRRLLTKKVILLSTLIFILTVSPLIAFDYFHKASNITTPIRILMSEKKDKVKPETIYHLDALFQSLGRVWYLQPFSNSTDEILYPCSKTPGSTTTKPYGIFSILSIFLFLYFALRKETWRNDKTRLLLLLSFSFLVPFTILPIINPVEYYLLGFFPLLFLIIGYLVESLKTSTKPLAYLIIIILVTLGVFTVLAAKGDYGMNTKKRMITRVMNIIGENPYDLKEEGACHKYEAWRYLFSVYARRPERSSEDEIFAWLYPDEVSSKATKYSVIIKETRAPQGIDQGYRFILQEGGFTAYIFTH